MRKPIEQMDYTPEGEDYMVDAWFGLVMYASKQEDYREQFKKDTDMDLSVIGSVGLDRMICDATGYTDAVVIKWCDWVTKNLWGIDGI